MKFMLINLFALIKFKFTFNCSQLVQQLLSVCVCVCIGRRVYVSSIIQFSLINLILKLHVSFYYIQNYVTVSFLCVCVLVCFKISPKFSAFSSSLLSQSELCESVSSSMRKLHFAKLLGLGRVNYYRDEGETTATYVLELMSFILQGVLSTSFKFYKLFYI